MAAKIGFIGDAKAQGDPVALDGLYVPESSSSEIAALPRKPLLITMRQFQDACGIKKTMAFAYVREKRVRSVLAGKRRLVLYADVERMVAEALESGSL